MTKNSKSNTNLFKNNNFSIEFNLSDSPTRPSDEIYKSVIIQPLDWKPGGKNLSQSARFAWRRGTLNAILRVWTESDIVDDKWHLYRKDNPGKVGGFIGYVHNSVVPQGVGAFFMTYVPGYGMCSMRSPISKVGEEFVQASKTTWLKVRMNSQNSGELMNGVIDAKYGISPSDILHDMVQAIHEGYRVVVDTTHHWNGEKYESYIHGLAVRLHENLQKPIEQVRAEMLNASMIRTENAKAEGTAKAVERLVEMGKARDTIVAATKGFTVLFDGKEVNVDAIPFNNYVLKVDGKTFRTSYPVMNARQRASLQYLNTDGKQLELVARQ